MSLSMEGMPLYSALSLFLYRSLYPERVICLLTSRLLPVTLSRKRLKCLALDNRQGRNSRYRKKKERERERQAIRHRQPSCLSVYLDPFFVTTTEQEAVTTNNERRPLYLYIVSHLFNVVSQKKHAQAHIEQQHKQEQEQEQETLSRIPLHYVGKGKTKDHQRGAPPAEHHVDERASKTYNGRKKDTVHSFRLDPLIRSKLAATRERHVVCSSREHCLEPAL